MVSFTEIAHAIHENPEKEFSVPSCIPKHQSVVPLYKLQKDTNAKKDPFEKIALKVQSTKSLPTPIPRSLSIMPKDTESEMSAPLAMPVTTPVVAPPAPAPAAAPAPASPAPAAPVVSKSSSKELSPKKSRHAQDPICIGISLRDPMYEIASSSVKQSIEAEEARILESKIAELYKNESGRSRGWTKTALDAFFLIRAASGGNVPPKEAFEWSTVFTNKQTSAVLDFICLAKGIRLAVWNNVEQCIGIWPAADLSTCKQTPPLFHVSQEGHLLQKTSVFESGWKIRAVLSVEHALEKLSVDELDSLAEKMGAHLEGKKTERVRSLASIRTELRLRQ
jgi:hypothetical protein